MDNVEQVTKLWDEILEAITKLGYIAAGTISISITFIGFLLGSQQQQQIHQVMQSFIFCKLPLVDLLFLSWILLFVSVLFSILARIPKAWHLFMEHNKLWFTKLQSSAPLETQANYGIVIERAEKGGIKYRIYRDVLIYGTGLSFIIGMGLLLTFAIFITKGVL